MQDWLAALLGKAHDRVAAMPLTSEDAANAKKHFTAVTAIYDDVFSSHMKVLSKTQEEVSAMRAERQQMLATYDRLYLIASETAERAIRAELERDALKQILDGK